MPRVTALRPARPGRVLVELDGERWRTIPLDVAAQSGLALADSLPLENAPQVALGALAPRERFRSGVERFAAAQLAPERPQVHAVELEAELEPAASRYLQRDVAPGLAIELNEHAPRPRGPKRRHSRHRLEPPP